MPKEFSFPNLIEEGRKYGLSEVEISKLSKYLNDKRMLRIINLEAFNRNARAWLSALTGIVAEVLAMDAHASIWLNKKLDKPRNWILSKLNQVIPTQIDDIAVKAIQVAQGIMDDTILPAKEKAFTKLSSRMHDKYDYHANATYLGNSLKDLKGIAKANLTESKAKAKDALKTLNKRKIETAMIGGYHDDDGDFRTMRKYGKRSTHNILLSKLQQKQNERRNVINHNAKQEIKENQQQQIQEGEVP